MTSNSCIPIAVLGGGPAGLAAGHAAAGADIPCAVLEAAPFVGGNCRTIAHGEFRFDTGAHRLHDRNAIATSLFHRLLDGELCAVSAPSRIAFHGRFVDFPLSPLNLLSALGIRPSLRAVGEVCRSRLAGSVPPSSFEAFATAMYGRTVADAFLLGYSAKLWGVPCSRLSPVVAGARLRGLGIHAMLKEMLPGPQRRARHLDGSFLYPRHGIGRLSERLAESCPNGVIHLNSRVTRVVHDGCRVRSVVVNDRERRDVRAVVSTVPLTRLVQMLEPAPPRPVLQAAEGLRWRHVLLVAIFLRRSTVTPCATVYFPDPLLPFTRVYEPRNRSAAMAPAGHTSLVAEVPFDEDSPAEARDPDRVTARVRESLERLGWIAADDIVACDARQLRHAYPVLDIDAPARVSLIRRYLETLENLRLAGRPGLFEYSHLHDQIQQGCEAVLSLRSHVAQGADAAYRETLKGVPPQVA